MIEFGMQGACTNCQLVISNPLPENCHEVRQEPYEVEYLATKLGVMPEEVRTAEAKVGKSRGKIEEYFRSKAK